MVLLGSAFWLKEGEEIRFDLVAGSMSRRGRHIVGVVVAAVTLVLFVMSLPATFKYVSFMKVESTAYLKIRLDVLYSVYVIFVVAIIVRYLWALWCPRGQDPETPPSPTEVSPRPESDEPVLARPRRSSRSPCSACRSGIR